MGQVTSWTAYGIFLAVSLKWMVVASVSATCLSVCVCVNGTEVSNAKSVTCVNGNLTEVPSDMSQEVIYLDVSANNITHIGQDTLSQDGLQFLDLSFNSIKSLENGVFDSLSNLETLNLSNNHISTIEANVFANLLSVQEINLSGNNLTFIDNETFSGLTTLKVLYLYDNKISVIESSFLSLENLLILDISYNRLTELEFEYFDGMIMLKELSVQHNKIEYIGNNTFISLTSLKTLNLSYNSLSTIEASTFSDLESLTSLSLKNNKIEDIEQGFIGNNDQLVNLILSENQLTNISFPLFVGLTKLERLSLSQMPSLTNVSHNALDGLPSLMDLDMSHNPGLTLVHPHLFHRLPVLASVDLSDCSLTMLSQITFHNNPDIHTVNLEGNQFLCTCSLAWLAKQAAQNSTIYGNNLDCLSNSQRQKLGDEAANLTRMCNDIPAANGSDTLYFAVGFPARMTCEFEPDPHTVVIWTTPRQRSLTYHAFHPEAMDHLLDEEETQLNSSFHRDHPWHKSSAYYSSLDSYRDRVILLSDGSLYIDYVLRTDTGHYKCLVLNANYNSSAQILVRLDYTVFINVKVMSIIIGLIAAFCFFLLVIVFSIISAIARRLINKRRREAIHKILENLDTYKTTQFARLRENYSGQLTRIRDQYHNQFQRLGDNYHSQMKRVKLGYSHQVERIRDNYANQVGRLRNYSSHQIEGIRERYNNQLLKMRDYGSLQLVRIHEKYKLQQQHVIKLLETMNLDNCKTVIETECLRTESMIFDVDILKDADTRPLSPVSGSDSEYMTASSENSSHDSLRLTPESDDGFNPDDLGGEFNPEDPELLNSQELNSGLMEGVDVELEHVNLDIDNGLHESIV